METQTLPKLTLPTYKVTLPVAGKEVRFRPFIVREEKILLMALESGDIEQLTDALKNIISECTFKKIDPNKMSIPDLCFMFLNIRAKSVGEISTPALSCRHCKETNTVDIDLTKVGVDKKENHTNKIILENGKGIIMKYPTIGMEDVVSAKSDTFSMVANCIETIFDNDNVYKSKDFTKEQLVNFIEELTHTQFENVLEFFNTLPELRHEVKFNCVKCKKENKIVLEGIRDFFL